MVLPRKVRSGELGPTSIVFNTTTEETVQLPLSGIRCMFIGRIDPPGQVVEAKGGGMGRGAIKLMGNIVAPGVGGLMAAGIDKAAGIGGGSKTGPGGASFYVLDLHSDEYQGPFRIESTGTNMRKFLGEEAGYSGEINMMLLLKKLAPHVVLDKTLQAVVERGKTHAPAFPDRDEFHQASMKAYNRARGLEPEETPLQSTGE